MGDMLRFTRCRHAVRLLSCILLEHPSYPHPSSHKDEFTYSNQNKRNNNNSSTGITCATASANSSLTHKDSDAVTEKTHNHNNNLRRRTSESTEHDRCSADSAATVTLQLYRDDPSLSCGVQLKQRRSHAEDSSGTASAHPHASAHTLSSSRAADSSPVKSTEHNGSSGSRSYEQDCPRVHRIDERLCQSSVLLRHLFPLGAPTDACAAVLRCVNGRAVRTMGDVQSALLGVRHITLQLQLQPTEPIYTVQAECVPLTRFTKSKAKSVTKVDSEMVTETSTATTTQSASMTNETKEAKANDVSLARGRRRHSHKTRSVLADVPQTPTPAEANADSILATSSSSSSISSMKVVHASRTNDTDASASEGGENVSDVWFTRRRAPMDHPRQPAATAPVQTTKSLTPNSKNSNHIQTRGDTASIDAYSVADAQSDTSTKKDDKAAAHIVADAAETESLHSVAMPKKRGRPRKTAALTPASTALASSSAMTHTIAEPSAHAHDRTIASTEELERAHVVGHVAQDDPKDAIRDAACPASAATTITTTYIVKRRGKKHAVTPSPSADCVVDTSISDSSSGHAKSWTESSLSSPRRSRKAVPALLTASSSNVDEVEEIAL